MQNNDKPPSAKPSSLKPTKPLKVAFTYNIVKDHTVEEAEFDTPETIENITKALESLGHTVLRIDALDDIASIIAKLKDFQPDLALNTAEGTKGKHREAIMPMIFESLAIPYIGSSPDVCVTTLDKYLSKLIVREEGVLTPKCEFVDAAGEIDRLGEEYIEGVDITVPFIENISNETNGILDACVYEFSDVDHLKKDFVIYDYKLKQTLDDKVDVKVARELSDELALKIREQSDKICKAFNIRDIARIDYRLNSKGQLYFLEINALPSLQEGAAIFISAAKHGYQTIAEVLGEVVGGNF